MLKIMSIIALALLVVSSVEAQKQKPAKQPADQRMEELLKLSEPIDPNAPPPAWILVTVHNSRFIWFSPSRLIRISRGTVKAWLRTESSSRPRVPLYTEDGRGVIEELELVEVNCPKREMRILSFVSYADDGAVVTSSDFKSPAWTHIVPNSLGEKQMGKICSWKRDKSKRD